MPECLNKQIETRMKEWINTVMSQPENNPIAHPPHYNQGRIECIDVIEDWKLGFHLGNAVKYICRAPHKGNEAEDLQKARWYIERRLRELQGSNEQDGGYMAHQIRLQAAQNGS